MKKYLNPKLYDMHIRVVNMKETDTRARLLNIIFTVNSFCLSDWGRKPWGIKIYSFRKTPCFS